MAFHEAQEPLSSGLQIVFQPIDTASSENGESFLNTGKEVFVFRSLSDTTMTGTILTSQLIDSDLPVADRSITIPGECVKVYGPFDRNVYSSEDGYVILQWNSGDEAGHSVAVVRLP